MFPLGLVKDKLFEDKVFEYSQSPLFQTCLGQLKVFQLKEVSSFQGCLYRGVPGTVVLHKSLLYKKYSVLDNSLFSCCRVL